MNRKETVIITTLSLLVIALVMLLSMRFWVRLDLTKNKSYTISRVSRETAATLPAELRITYFVSERLKNNYAFPGEIEDILREYAARSRGNIRVTLKDPVKAGLEETVAELGIQGQQIQVVEKNQATLAIVYSGLLLEYLNKSDVVPLVFNTETLEYDLTTRIRSIVMGNDRRIGVLIGDGGKTIDGNFSYLRGSLENSGFKVTEITAPYEIPDSLPSLIVLGGADNLEESALYRIDRFVQLGGKVMFALDALKVYTEAGMMTLETQDKGLLKMTASYGAEIEKSFALDESNNIITTPGANGMYSLVAYPFFISVLPEYGSREHPVTSAFNGADLYWASPIKLAPPEGITAETLFTSTERAWLQTGNYNVNPSQRWAWNIEKDATTGEKVLAVSLRGIFPKYYAQKPAPEDGGEGDALPDMPSVGKESRIIVLGDAKAFDNQWLQLTQSQRTLDFLVLASEWLSNDDDIIGIRSRAPSAQKLDKILDEEARIRAMSFSRTLGTVFMPLVVIALGVFMIGARKKREALSKTEEPREEGK